MNKGYNENMIIRNGKLIYAISLKEKSKQNVDNSYICMEDGKIRFIDSVFRTTEFDFNDENHKIAKEIFITELQTDIKRRILELKQLQSIFSELNLQDCFGSVIEDNTKILLEVKEEVEKISDNMKCDVEDVVRNNLKNVLLTKKEL